jgi:hypothetical protein
MHVFVTYVLSRFSVLDLLPIAAMLLVLASSVVLAWRRKNCPPALRLSSIGAFVLLFVAVALLVLQPMVQVYLERELGMIFLEADKYTGFMRNLRYVLYPLAMLVLGFVIFEDRIEQGSGEKDQW